jgi:hypothetical protein
MALGSKEAAMDAFADLSICPALLAANADR